MVKLNEANVLRPALKLAGGVSSVVVSWTTGQLGSAIDALLAPSKLKVIQGAWQDQPIILPDATAIMDCFRREFIGADIAKYGLSAQGVNLGWKLDDHHQRNADVLWRAVYQSTQELPSVAFIMDVASRGYFDDRQLDLGSAITRAGGSPDLWRGYIDTFYEFPTIGDLIEARNRGLINDARFDESLKRNGLGHAWTREMFNKMRDRLPGAADLIHFAVKEAFSVDIAAELHLNYEFPTDITPYMQGQGLAWELGFNVETENGERIANVMDLYWAAHWQPISASQAFDMMHLLRPERLGRYAAAGVNATEFTILDVKRWLRINDYPPTVRENLAALSFTPLRLVDIRHALTLNYRVRFEPGFADGIPVGIANAIQQWDRLWGVNQFRDRGVLPEDADAQVDMVYADAADKMAGPARMLNRGVARRTFAIIIKSYGQGFMPRDQAFQALRNVGCNVNVANTYLDAEDAERQFRYNVTVMRALRRAFLTGAIGANRVQEGLREAGFPEARSNELLGEWQSEFNLQRRTSSTSRVINWVAQGMMTPQQGRDYLANLGWTNPDLALFLAEAQGKALKLRGQAIRAADMDRRRRTAELDRIRREQIRNINSIQQALRRATPVSTLQRWLRKGQVTRAYVVTRLEQMGYTPALAQQYATDAIQLVPVATLQRWLRKREISESTFRANLAAQNLTPETIDKYVQDAMTPEPQRIYPKLPADATSNQSVNATQHAGTTPATPGQLPPGHPLPTTTETVHVTGTQTQVLNTQPEQLHTQPDRLGGAIPPAGQGS